MTDRSPERDAIGELVAVYCTAYDTADATRFAGLFTEDAHFHGLGIDERGRSAIVGQLMPDGRPSGRLTHHIVGDPEIVFGGDDRAQVTTRFAVVIASDDARLFGAGVYADSVVRTDRGGDGDGWRIADRAVGLDVPLTAMNVDAGGAS